MQHVTENQDQQAVTTKRGRGRPRADYAFTAAERQKEYRRRKSIKFGKNLNFWVSHETEFALRRLAVYHQQTVPQIIEQLVKQADDQIIENLHPDKPGWNEYFLQTTTTE